MSSPEIINIGTGYDITIFELAKINSKKTQIIKEKLFGTQPSPMGCKEGAWILKKLKINAIST